VVDRLDHLAARTCSPRGKSLKRVVVRLPTETIEKIDALLPRLRGASRASLIRAYCILGLDLTAEGRSTPVPGPHPADRHPQDAEG
jgi:hypothetical protein